MDQFKTMRFPYSRQIKKTYKEGNLWQTWIDTYPHLFKIEIDAWCPNQYRYGYCFYEMQTAIVIHQSTGYLCLTDYVKPKKHPHDKEIMLRMMQKDLYDLVVDGRDYGGKHPQGPDLFFYSPDYSSWFFCEVKGENDRVSNQQKAFFTDIMKVSNNRFYICEFFPTD